MIHSKAHTHSAKSLKDNVKAARGLIPSDLVLKDVRFLDVFSGEFHTSDIAIHNGMIVGTLSEYAGKEEHHMQGLIAVPGFIDTHVHVESSMMTPSRFQQAVLPCGTTTVVWDPHEIANVWGTKGIQWALTASENLLLDFFVMLPSCVPSTTPSLHLETSGAHLTARHLLPFRKQPRVLGLAEMMNFPGLLNGEPEVNQKLLGFKDMLRDGHCPGLTGKDLNAYGVAGIHSCHESTAIAEAQEKLRKGIHVLIREGSCAKDADELLPLLNAYTCAELGLCSDDRNPLDIALEGHISFIINKALKAGHRPQDIFRAASYTAAKMYGLSDRGAIAPGYVADVCLIKCYDNDWRQGFNVIHVLKRGKLIDRQELQIKAAKVKPPRQNKKNLHLKKFLPDDFRIKVKSAEPQIMTHVVGVRPGQIVTDHLRLPMQARDGYLHADVNRDILKIAVLERHHGTGHKSLGLVQGFNLNVGAIATSINHDSHNVIVVGVNADAMYKAVKKLQAIDGGIVVNGEALGEEALPLPVAGLMSQANPEDIAKRLAALKTLTKKMGCKLQEPFLTLSFLALPVIPSLKITDRGLVDVEKFRLIGLQEVAYGI